MQGNKSLNADGIGCRCHLHSQVSSKNCCDFGRTLRHNPLVGQMKPKKVHHLWQQSHISCNIVEPASGVADKANCCVTIAQVADHDQHFDSMTFNDADFHRATVVQY